MTTTGNTHSVPPYLRSVDAATTDLEVRVVVRRGVVHLRGRVPNLVNAENAEEVAFRIEGVVDVIDELEISDLA